MEQTCKKLRKYRRMGSMEQIFTIFNDYKIGWGAAAGLSHISKLSEIPLHKVQALWNKVHYKYEALQAQYLTVPSVYQFDWIYIGCVPFKIIKCEEPIDLHQLLVRELNFRYLLLNDLNITQSDITHNKYDIADIPPLYRIIICGDHWMLSYNHGIGDGMSWTMLFNDFMCLLNGDTFDDTPQKYSSVEQCIDPKYAKSSLINTLTNYLVPSWFAINFNKFYCNNRFLSHYNPLGLHPDDILRTQFVYAREYNNKKMVAFPLCESYDKYNFNIDFIQIGFTKTETVRIKKQCQTNKVHISSLLQYIVNAAMIESYPEALCNDYYETVIGNVFSSIPLYREPNKIPIGIHASSYYNVIPYERNTKIGSVSFWKMIHQISAKLLDRDKDQKRIRNIYKKKFPFMNMKKFLQYAWDDRSNWMGKLPCPPTVTNPGVFNLNKPHWKHQIVDSFGSANPGVGMGAAYLLGAGTVQGIDEMGLNFTYGTQFISREKATEITNRIKQKMQQIAALNIPCKL
eukprot:131657_1